MNYYSYGTIRAWGIVSFTENCTMSTESDGGPIVKPEEQGSQNNLGQVDRKLRRELVFGFVCPMGSERDAALRALTDSLEHAKYVTKTIFVSKLLEEYVDPALLLESGSLSQRIVGLPACCVSRRELR